MATDVNPIKKLREERGLTQRALADALGITDQTVSNVERGQRPTLDVALALARFYGVPAEDLFAPSVSTQEVVAATEVSVPAGVSAPSSPVAAGARLESVDKVATE